MLNTQSKIQLAKVLMGINTGDWTELFALTDCNDIYEEIPRFDDHVKWENTELKQICIRVVTEILERDENNIIHIWELANVKTLIRNNNYELYKEIKAIIDNEEYTNVSVTKMNNHNENIYEALKDAEVLLTNSGPQYAYDRMHTALHSTLRQICTNHAIPFDENNDGVNALLPKINTHLKNMADSDRNDKVFAMLRSANSMLDGINYLRNHNSMAHPTQSLLNEVDAKFAINLTRSIMSYVDGLLK